MQLMDLKKQTGYHQRSISDVRNDEAHLNADFHGHVIHTDGSLNEVRTITDGIHKDVETAHKQIGELVWIYERVDSAVQHTHEVLGKVDSLTQVINNIKNHKPQPDFQLNGFKREMRGKVEALNGESQKTLQYIAMQ